MRIHLLSRSLAVWAVAACVAVLLLGGRAEAQSTYTWANSNITATPPSLLDWFTGGSNPQGTWTGGNPVSSNLNTIQFFADTTTALTNTVAATQTVNLNNGGSAFQLGTLTLNGRGSSTNNANLTMTLSGDALNFSGATGTINLGAVSSPRPVNYNVNNNIQLGTANSGSVLTLDGAGTSTFTFGGIISELQAGGGSVVKNGSSTLTLSGSNTFSGGVTLNAGTLSLGNNAALGAGTLTIAGGALNVTAARTTTNNNTQAWNGDFTFVGTNTLNLGTGAVTMNADRTVTVTANTLTVGGAIGDGGSGFGLTKAGAGTLVLGGANTYTGSTRLNAGILVISSDANLSGTNSTLVFNGGTLRIDGTTLTSLNPDRPTTFTSGTTIGFQINTAANTFTVGQVLNQGTGGLTKTGVGVLALGAANTYTGVTTVSAGVLRLNNANALPGGIGATGGTSNLTLAGGILGLTSDFSRSIGTSASQVQLSGTFGFAAYGADRKVNFGGNATPSTIVWGDSIANGGFNGAVMTLGDATATHTIELANGLDLGSVERRIYVGDSTATVVDAKFSGNIVGSGTLWFQGGNTGGGGFLLTGSNSYSGGTTLYRGLLFIDNANALGTGPMEVLFGNTTFASTASTPLTIPNQLRAQTWNGSAFTLGHAIATGDLILAGGMRFSGGAPVNVNSNVEFSGPITGDATTVGAVFTVSGGKTLRFSGDIVGGSGAAFNLEIKGSGLTVISGSNTFNGNTTLSAGRLDLNSARALSTGTLTIANSTTLGNSSGGAITLSTNNAQTWNGNFTFAGTNDLNLGTGTVSLGGATRTVDVASNTLTVGGVISGNAAVGLTKNGPGTLALGGANTYTGNTTVNAGTLVLDYGTQNNSKLSDTGSLTIGGVGVVLKGGTHTETVSAATVNAGGSTISRDGSTGVLQLNAITRNAAGTLVFGEASIATTDTLNTNGILGGWATVGNDWAVNSTNATDGAITALASYTGTLPMATGASTANYTLTGDQTQTAAVSANTVKITNTGNSETLSLGANNLTITAASATSLGGILYAGGGDGNYTIASTTGRIVPSTANQELIFQTTSGTLTVNAFVAAGSASSPVTKGGAGTLVLGAANTFTGALRVNQGALRLTNSQGAGSTAGGIVVQNAAALELANSISVGNEGLTLNGSGISNAGALRNISGTNNYAGGVTLGMATRINSDAGALNLTGNISGAGLGLTLGGAGNISISSIIGTGAGSLTKDGAGTLTLSGANTYTGATAISGGRLHVSAGNINSTSGVTVNGSGAEFKYNSATAYTKPLTLTQGMISGTGTISASGGVSVGSNAILSPGNSPGIQGYTTGLTWAGGGSYLWEINDWTGEAGTAYDQVAVSGSPLAITASSGSPFTILITSLTGANAAGDVPNFDGSVSKTFTIATSSAGITGFDASNFTLSASGFSNTYSGSWSLASTGSTVLLNYVAGPTTTTGTYSLSASAGAATIIAGGSSTITATITNTGAGAADALNYGSLAVGQGVSISPSSGSNLAQTASGTGTGVFTSSTPGTYTFDPTASVTNATLGGAAVLSGSTSTSVTVLDHATSSLSALAVLTSSTISLGKWDYDLQSWTDGSGTNLFSIFNLNPNSLDPAFVALLDLTGTSATGDAGFTLDAGLTPGSFAMIAGGTSATYSVSFDPTGLNSQGSFTRTFTFNMADQNLPGTQATNTLSVTATVIVVPEPAAIALLASAALTGWAAWKRRRALRPHAGHLSA